jgi:hypothetical protein
MQGGRAAIFRDIFAAAVGVIPFDSPQIGMDRALGTNSLIISE